MSFLTWKMLYLNFACTLHMYKLTAYDYPFRESGCVTSEFYESVSKKFVIRICIRSQMQC
jgi:hypothetical protein